MKSKLFLISFILFSGVCLGQKKVTWTDLSNVEFTDKFFPEYGELFLYPNFDKNLILLDGQQITITGYFLNISPDDNIYILSKEPMAMCFFCGRGGPETAIELKFKTKPQFKTDDIVTVTGTLNLNADDVNHLIYILSNCSIQKAN